MVFAIETLYRTISQASHSMHVVHEMRNGRDYDVSNTHVFLSDPDGSSKLMDYTKFYAGLYRPSYDTCDYVTLDKEVIISELSADAYQLMQDMVAHF